MQMPIINIGFHLQLLFILFFIGQKLHSELMDLNGMIYNSHWYRYPRSVQRFVFILMMRAQQPFHLSAYGIMECNLRNFVGVSL